MPDPILRRERWKLVARLARALESPMLVLSGLWIVLLVVELTGGLSPLLARVNDAIWILFIAQFGIEFLLAPDKRLYLRRQWITALSLVVPAFRLLRIGRLARVMRAGRAARGLRLARVLGSINRGMRALAITFRRRGAGYVLLLTLLVLVTGAAGMYRFEMDAPGGPGLPDYATALWWTAMLLTTMGSEYWPRTAEGRVLCLLLALYAFAIFGYVTATIAAWFIGRDAVAQR